uniref:Transmembrane protein n=1 Tax=Steinernema glaseri TaxID=37863 RepID=A0A1I7ZMM5_9BILA
MPSARTLKSAAFMQTARRRRPHCAERVGKGGMARARQMATAPEAALYTFTSVIFAVVGAAFATRMLSGLIRLLEDYFGDNGDDVAGLHLPQEVLVPP